MARGLRHQRFPKDPKKALERCSVREFVMRELDGHDEKDIGAWIDMAIAANPAIAKDTDKLKETENRESIRRALVSVDGVEVNIASAPYQGMEGWSRRTMNFAAIAFRDMNGIEVGEVGEFLAVEGTKTEKTPTTAENQKATAAAPSAA